MRFILLLLFVAGNVSVVFSQDWELDLNTATEKAKDTNKTIILVFSGSDWCAPCIKLEKDIWRSETFQEYAKTNFVMLRADFPRKKANKLPKEQENKNALLAEKYNPNGYFPSVVILDKNKKVLGVTGYKKLEPKAYIAHLNNFIK